MIWMPRELKDRLGGELRKSALLQGLGEGFVDKIADEVSAQPAGDSSVPGGKATSCLKDGVMI